MTHNNYSKKYSKLSEHVCVNSIQHYREKIYNRKNTKKKYMKQRTEVFRTWGLTVCSIMILSISPKNAET